LSNRKSERVDFEVTLEVSVHVDATRTFTVAAISSVTEDGMLVEGIGVAKRNPEDEFDLKVGWGLAIKRALNDMADKFSEY
jgi:hypothetical protein